MLFPARLSEVHHLRQTPLTVQNLAYTIRYCTEEAVQTTSNLTGPKAIQKGSGRFADSSPICPRGVRTMTMKCIFRSGDNNGLQDELDKTTTRVERYNNRETGCMSEKPRLVSFMRWRCSRQDEWSSTDVQCRLNITGYLIGDRRTTFLTVQVNHCFPMVCLFGCTAPRPGSD